MISLDISAIIITIVSLGNAWAICIWTSRRLDKSTPVMKPVNTIDNLDQRLKNKPLFQKTWFILLCELMVIVYVLSEVSQPGVLTRLAVYKIVMGTGLFFFILLQSTISRVVETIYKMKSADLELVKGFLTKTNK